MQHRVFRHLSTNLSIKYKLLTSLELPFSPQEAEKNPEVLYTDQNGNRNGEYLSLGVDCLPLFEGRSPVQIYHDFMESFRDTFHQYLGDCIVVCSICGGLISLGLL